MSSVKDVIVALLSDYQKWGSQRGGQLLELNLVSRHIDDDKVLDFEAGEFVPWAS